jgi:hypothetical protein
MAFETELFMKSSNLLVIILVLQVLILCGQWFGGLPQAQAQIPDAGAQRNEIIDNLKDVNAKLDKLVDILQNGVVQVKVARPDDKADDKTGGN